MKHTIEIAMTLHSTHSATKHREILGAGAMKIELRCKTEEAKLVFERIAQELQAVCDAMNPPEEPKRVEARSD